MEQPAPWRSEKDEFVWVVQGEVVLVTDDGEEILRAGDCAGFKAGRPNGHQWQNRSSDEAPIFEIGSRRPGIDEGDYPTIDLHISSADSVVHKDGRPKTEWRSA